MFLEESNKYYKRKERNEKFRKYHSFLLKAIFIFAFLSGVLYFLPTYSGSRGGSNDNPSDPSSSKESHLFSDEFYNNLFADKSYVLSTEKDRKQCVADSTNWLSDFCNNHCEKERKTFPRPLVQNSCQNGCTQGGTRTIDSECNKDHDLLKLMKDNGYDCAAYYGKSCNIICESITEVSFSTDIRCL